MGAGSEILDVLKRLEAKIDGMWADVEAIKLARSSAPTAPAASKQAPLNDAFLDANEWADKTIQKDPPRWNGGSYVGRRYSQCPPDYLEVLAGYLDWKAANPRKDDAGNVLTNNKGRPWHEVDAFEAQIVRAWARRNAARGPAMAAPAAAYEAPADDPLPF